jgi:hypothetical protein
MAEDRFGMELSSHNSAAITSFDQALDAFLKHEPGALDHLATALQADPDFAAAHAIKGLFHILQAREEPAVLAGNALAAAIRTAQAQTLTHGEQVLAPALAAGCKGQWMKAADILEAGLDPQKPHAPTIKIAHSLRFMAGDVGGLLTLTEPYAARTNDEIPGLGFILGCHAFALEESGRFGEAEPLAQTALHREPKDIWAMHALAHVYDVTNRTGEGLLWVESGRQQWAQCNNFSNHMSWHLALFCLDRGKYDRVVDIYDNDLNINRTGDFRDFANAVSLLVRLQQMGVDIGSRLKALHAEARDRAADTTYVYASLHNLLVLLANKDFKNAQQLTVAMRQMATEDISEQARVARIIGVPLAEAFLTVADGPATFTGLAELAHHLQALGGSFVQRDLFLRAMIVMADDVCDHTTTSSLIKLRTVLRHEDAFTRLIENRICFGGSSSDILHVA